MERLRLKIMFFIMALGFVFFLTGCGGGSSVYAVIDGQTMDLPVDSTDVAIGGLGGVVIPGSESTPYSTTVRAVVRYRWQMANDYFLVEFKDAYSIPLFESFTPDGYTTLVDMTVNGIPAVLNDGSVTLFVSKMPMAEGQTLEFEAEVITPGAYWKYDISKKARPGY